METDFIILSEYCRETHIEPSFVVLLEEEGLIDTCVEQGIQYIAISQLPSLERYTRLYYELSINVEGIGAVSHLLEKIGDMQSEIRQLRSRLRSFQVEIREE